MSKSGKFWTSFQNLPARVSFRLQLDLQMSLLFKDFQDLLYNYWASVFHALGLA